MVRRNILWNAGKTPPPRPSDAQKRYKASWTRLEGRSSLSRKLEGELERSQGHGLGGRTKGTPGDPRGILSEPNKSEQKQRSDIKAKPLSCRGTHIRRAQSTHMHLIESSVDSRHLHSQPLSRSARSLLQQAIHWQEWNNERPETS